MIDVHSHLLPGVDDGSRSFEQSVDVLQRFAADGVECVVLTPHLNVSRLAEAPYERHVEILAAEHGLSDQEPGEVGEHGDDERRASNYGHL